MNYDFIKETVFKTVDFNFDGEIETFDCDGVKVLYDGKTAKIGSKSQCTFARGCFLLALNITEGKKEFEIEEEKHFDEFTFFLDCSRNAVMKVDAIKRYINIIASLGFDSLMLYTEDTYKIEGRPRFGYLRGRYTKEEIHEVVEYGEKMGVEIIPCIQTLGHMEQYLKWAKSGGPDYTGEGLPKLKDTASVLLCDSEDTYKFIEDEIRTCREYYKTDKIHIGMDEAHDMGLGRYLRLHGYQNRFEVISKHLNVVVEICKKHGLKPMIWSDMFFRLGTGVYYRYNFDFPEGFKESIPDAKLIYWDYYHDNPKTYDGMFKKHFELSDNIGFAGAVTGYNSFLPAHDYTYLNSVAAVESCLRHNVKSVIVTTWGDDGNEANAFLLKHLLPIYSEYCYKGQECSGEDISKASEFLTKIKFEDAKKMGNMSFLKQNEWLEGNRELYGNDLLMGKRLFYSDILYDMSVNPDSCDEIMSVYDSCAEKMDELEKKKDKNREDFRYAYLIYRICSKKAEFVKLLRKSYKNGDKDYLKKVLCESLPELKLWYEELLKIHKKQWMSVYKPFGFEVLNFRYGGIMARIDYCMEVLSQYLNGELSEIGELEEEILYNEETYPAIVQDLISPSFLL